MRIAVLHNHPIHYKHLLFTALAERGIDVDVVFTARSSTIRTPDLQPSGNKYRSHFLFAGSFERLPQIRTALKAIRGIAQCNADVVVISGWSYLPTWSVLAWTKFHRKPVALWFETNVFDHPRHWIKEWVKRIYLRGFAVAHVYGTSNREYLELLGMDPAVILEKRATVDAGIFMKRRATFHSDFRRFIYVGRLSPEKNLPRLLDAFHQIVPRYRAELVVVGYGPLEAMLKERVRDLGLTKSVVFTGAKTQEEVSRLLADSDCLILPSLSETWGLVANEALCVGVPLIVSDRCGCARDLATEASGWTFAAENTAELAQVLTKVCELPVQRLQQMSEAAVRIAAEYAPDRCAERIATNLEELLERHTKLAQ